MKTLLTLLAAILLAGCELIDTTSEPQIENTKRIVIWGANMPHPLTLQQPLSIVNYHIDIHEVGSFDVEYTDVEPTCGDNNPKNAHVSLLPGIYYGTVQYEYSYGIIFYESRVNAISITVREDGEQCIILNAAQWNKWN